MGTARRWGERAGRYAGRCSSSSSAGNARAGRRQAMASRYSASLANTPSCAGLQVAQKWVMGLRMALRTSASETAGSAIRPCTGSWWSRATAWTAGRGSPNTRPRMEGDSSSWGGSTCSRAAAQVAARVRSSSWRTVWLQFSVPPPASPFFCWSWCSLRRRNRHPTRWANRCRTSAQYSDTASLSRTLRTSSRTRPSVCVHLDHAGRYSTITCSRRRCCTARSSHAPSQSRGVPSCQSHIRLCHSV
mmetsp:Transcript_41117/g.73682  ORF Transcript_41117/g.73682 Transcript_41117/m.73682 type:complete len:246 (+) Transcript_41117:819-1556(+)